MRVNRSISSVVCFQTRQWKACIVSTTELNASYKSSSSESSIAILRRSNCLQAQVISPKHRDRMLTVTVGCFLEVFSFTCSKKLISCSSESWVWEMSCKQNRQTDHCGNTFPIMAPRWALLISMFSIILPLSGLANAMLLTGNQTKSSQWTEVNISFDNLSYVGHEPPVIEFEIESCCETPLLSLVSPAAAEHSVGRSVRVK